MVLFLNCNSRSKCVDDMIDFICLTGKHHIHKSFFKSNINLFCVELRHLWLRLQHHIEQESHENLSNTWKNVFAVCACWAGVCVLQCVYLVLWAVMQIEVRWFGSLCGSLFDSLRAFDSRWVELVFQPHGQRRKLGAWTGRGSSVWKTTKIKQLS